MSIGANSYGSVASVAALTRAYTKAGSYDTTTNPTQAAVEGWIDQVSADLNLGLAQAGFIVPVSQADAKLALDAVVNEAVADLAHAANSAGRFFTEKAQERGVSPMRAIRREIAEWVATTAPGFVALGVPVKTPTAEHIAYRDVDEAELPVSPLFERKAWNNPNREWDE